MPWLLLITAFNALSVGHYTPHVALSLEEYIAMLRRLTAKFNRRNKANAKTPEDANEVGAEGQIRELQLMLDAMPVNVMVCDTKDDFKIFYINET
ncbi:MAG: hypothetical protein QGI52_01805, partial [Alphaproteobacteria bacterium]|nr:hypothetical protein [Alphaproteobacteria bacterium]